MKHTLIIAMTMAALGFVSCQQQQQQQVEPITVLPVKK